MLNLKNKNKSQGKVPVELLLIDGTVGDKGMRSQQQMLQ